MDITQWHLNLLSHISQNTPALFTLACCLSMSSTAENMYHADVVGERYPQIPQSLEGR